jgi:hypothetical protein
MRFALYEHPDGVDVPAGNAVGYDVMRNVARVGPVWIDGQTLLWEVADEDREDAKLSVDVDLDPATQWLMRCDRVDFPAGAVAYLHTHPGPGIRCLLHGSLRVDAGDRTHSYGLLGAWFEAADEPVLATASPTDETSFVRVLLLPREWQRRRTIRYVNPEDEEKPKTQRATVFLEAPLAVA